MFKRLLVPVDGTPLAEQALDTAAHIARECGGELSIVLAHQPRRRGVLDRSLDYEIPSGERRYVERLAADVAQRARVRVEAVVELGGPADVICHRTMEVGSDLIVMASHGRTGVDRALNGSVADAVLRQGDLPVLVLRPAAPGAPRQAHAFRNILVPLDGSTTSSAILPVAAAMARCSGGTLSLLRVVAPVPLYAFDAMLPAYAVAGSDDAATRHLTEAARDELALLAPGIAREYGVTVHRTVVTAASAGFAILDMAKTNNVDLIAMTTHGRHASRLVLGSVTDEVLRGGSCPLLLYRPQGARQKM